MRKNIGAIQPYGIHPAAIKIQAVPNIKEKLTAGKGAQKPTFEVHQNPNFISRS